MVTIKRIIRETNLEMYYILEDDIVIAFLVMEVLTIEKNKEDNYSIFKSIDDFSCFKDYIKADVIFDEDYQKKEYTEQIFSVIDDLIPTSAFEVTYYLTTHLHSGFIEQLPLILNQEEVRTILTLINSKYNISMLQLNRF